MILLIFQYKVGDIIKINGEERKVVTVTNSSHMVVNTGFTNTATLQTHSRTWEYSGLFDKEPVTTQYSQEKGSLFDEIHVVVVDEDGEWTGNREEGLELFTGLSVPKVQNLKMEQTILCGRLNRRSSYVYWMDHDSTGDLLRRLWWYCRNFDNFGEQSHHLVYNSQPNWWLQFNNKSWWWCRWN